MNTISKLIKEYYDLKHTLKSEHKDIKKAFKIEPMAKLKKPKKYVKHTTSDFFKPRDYKANEREKRKRELLDSKSDWGF